MVKAPAPLTPNVNKENLYSGPRHARRSALGGYCGKCARDREPAGCCSGGSRGNTECLRCSARSVAWSYFDADEVVCAFTFQLLNSKVDTKAISSATAYRFSFSGKKSKWGCLHASLSECKTKSNISPEILSTGVSLSKRVTHWLIGTSFRSIPRFQLNTASPLAIHRRIRANSRC